jgi:hypothetical protein
MAWTRVLWGAFQAGDERMDHIAGRFQCGLIVPAWKLPSRRPKDFRSGSKPLPKDGDNTDDDMDYNVRRPSGRKPRSQEARKN